MTEQTKRQHSVYNGYQCSQWCKAVLHYDIPWKPWEIVGADVSMINNKTFFNL